MDFMNILQSLIVQATYAVSAFVIGYLWNKSRDLAKRQRNTERGIQALLKVELRRIHERSMQRGFITYADEEFAEEVYLDYKTAGGDGQGTMMIEDLRKLEVVSNASIFEENHRGVQTENCKT